MDVELTLGVVESLDDLGEIILVSGDSDYLALIELAYSKSKAVRIVSFRKLLSWELRTFAEKNDNCDL